MNQGENRGFGGDDLLNLERQLQGWGKKQEVPKQELPPQTQQQPPQQESYTTPKLSPEEQELSNKLNEANKLPRRTKEENAIRVKKLEEITGLTWREFRGLYHVCPLGSKDEHPDGYHVAIHRGKEVRIKPEIIPAGLAEDAVGNELLPCYYHYIGFITGAIARNKPYEVLPFNPSQDLQQIVESATQEYKIVVRQNPRRNPSIKQEDDIMAAVIFEDAESYADPLKRQEVAGYLQRAVQSFKEGQITRDELAAIVRNKGKTAPAQETTAVTEAQLIADKIVLAGVYEIDYIPSSRERIEDVNSILNNLGHMLKTPFSILYPPPYAKKDERAKVSLGGEATQEYFNGIAPLAQRLDAIFSMWRNDPTKGKEAMDNVYQAFGHFGQQQQ